MVFACSFYYCGNSAHVAGITLDNLLFAWLDTPVRSKIYTCDECEEIRCTTFVSYLNKEETAFKKIPTTCVLAEMDLGYDAKWVECRSSHE